ncbi:hypothetical protein OG850_00250 [Streptomyces pseudovenezuelae]
MDGDRARLRAHGAVIDLWQTTADGRYAGLAPEQAGPLEGLDVAGFDLPKYHLRGKIVADAEGRYEYRTFVPGVEPAAVPVGRLDDLPQEPLPVARGPGDTLMLGRSRRLVCLLPRPSIEVRTGRRTAVRVRWCRCRRGRRCRGRR